MFFSWVELQEILIALIVAGKFRSNLKLQDNHKPLVTSDSFITFESNACQYQPYARKA